MTQPAAHRFAGYASPGIVLEALRSALARTDALFPLSVMGLLAGLVTGMVIVAFRLLTEHALVSVGWMDNAENFEALTWQWRLALPTGGGLAIGLLFQLVSASSRQVGPGHVMAQLELPCIVLLGVVVGCLAAAYVYGTKNLDIRSRHLPLWLRTTAAGAFTGLCALVAPARSPACMIYPQDRHSMCRAPVKGGRAASLRRPENKPVYLSIEKRGIPHD